MNNELIHKELASGIIQYIENRRDEKLEKFLSEKPKKNKKEDITNGAINFRTFDFLSKYLKENNRRDSLDYLVKIEKLTKSKETSKLEFQLDKFKQYWKLLGEELPEEALSLKSELDNFINENNETHVPVNWLNEWTSKAKDISFATHVAKLTHSSSKGSSVFDSSQDVLGQYLDTASLSIKAVDTASDNAASLPIADILNINVNGHSVLSCLKNNEIGMFLEFCDDPDTVNAWVDSLKQAYDDSNKKSFFLNKQIYFPVETEQYHLLLPLVSSSLAQNLHEEFQELFSDEQKQAKERRKSNKYSDVTIVSYPNKAVLNVTQSNHSNASKLNGTRGGRLSLLSCAPPQWNSKLPSYKNKNSLFDRGLSVRLNDGITGLRNYLLVLKNKELSLSKPQRNAAIKGKVSNIIAGFFDFVLMVNTSENKQGWTMETNLPLRQQLLFEPWRNDGEVEEILSNSLWQEQLGKDFGRWLNKQLNTSKKGSLQLTPIHEALWSSWFLIELKEHIALQEAMQ